MIVANNEKATKKIGGITGKGFMPGQSGNPLGRPKNSLKSYVARKLAAMSDEEKEKWLKDNKVPPELIWQMGEGRPHQTQETDLTTQGEKLESVNLTDAIVAQAKKIQKQELKKPHE